MSARWYSRPESEGGGGGGVCQLVGLGCGGCLFMSRSHSAAAPFGARGCAPTPLFLSSRRDCHNAEPGFFRLCFAWMPKESLTEAVTRIKTTLGSSKS
jgi:hypothetical protein